MTKKELIKILEEFEDDENVYIKTFPFDEDSSVVQIEVAYNVFFKGGKGILLSVNYEEEENNG